MRYPKETFGYYFYNRSEGKVFVAQNGVFLEKEFLKEEKSGKMVQLEEVRDEPIGQDSTSDTNAAEQVEMPMATEAPLQPRRSARLGAAWELLMLDNDEPATYAEAMVDPDSRKWQDAMKSEIESLKENQVWNLVDRPDGVTTIECKWIYKKKKDIDGNVHIYKARLVAKGVDYDDA